MALEGGYINLYLDIKRSEQRRRLVVRWETRDRNIGGNIDLTDLFLSIMEFWNTGQKEMIMRLYEDALDFDENNREILAEIRKGLTQ